MGPAPVKPTKEEAEYLASVSPLTQFDNDGNIRGGNREQRRKRKPSDPKYTKATHSQKIKLYGRKKNK